MQVYVYGALKDYTLYYKNSDNEVVSCQWGKVQNNKINLNITSRKGGNGIIQVVTQDSEFDLCINVIVGD